MFNKKDGEKNYKKIAKYAAKKEAKIIFGSLLTIGTHKLMKKVARKYPGMSFLKSDAD